MRSHQFGSHTVLVSDETGGGIISGPNANGEHIFALAAWKNRDDLLRLADLADVLLAGGENLMRAILAFDEQTAA
jgi:hypothetical protein